MFAAQLRMTEDSCYYCFDFSRTFTSVREAGTLNNGFGGMVKNVHEDMSLVSAERRAVVQPGGSQLEVSQLHDVKSASVRQRLCLSLRIVPGSIMADGVSLTI